MIDIDKLLELESNATKEPWEVKTLTSHNALSGGYGLTYKHLYIQGMPLDVFDEHDLDLVCAMRNNIRPLLLELKAARKVVEAARKLHDMLHVRHVANLYNVLKELNGDE